MNIYIILIICIITKIMASNQDALCLLDQPSDALALSNIIRLGDVSDQNVIKAIEILKEDICKKKDLDATQEKIAYALALSSSSPVFDKKTSEQLQAIQVMATPKILGGAGDFIFVKSQIQNYSVVMEKATKETKELWKMAPNFLEEAVKEDKKEFSDQERLPFTPNKNIWVSYVMEKVNLARKMFLSTSPKILEEAAKEKEFSDKETDYIHAKKTAIGSFIQRMCKLSYTLEYDIWVSYLTQEDPMDIFNRRLEGIEEADAKKFLSVRKIAMIMSIQADHKTECYSPMGIVRTDAEDSRLEKLQKCGEMPPKPYINISVLFHALTCKMVKHKYTNVFFFWTQPLPIMRSILAIALHPNISFCKHNNGIIEIKGKTQKVINKKFQTPWSPSDPSDPSDPSYSVDFITCKSACIKVENLLNVLFPYTEIK